MRRILVLAVVGLLGLIATGVVTAALRVQAEDEVAARFAEDADDAADLLIRQLESGVGSAEAARGLQLASDVVTVEDFATFVEQLRLTDRFPSAQGVAITYAVRPDEVDALTAHLRDAGQEGFAVYPDEPVGGVRWPISFIEPIRDNAAAVGFDIRARPEARTAAQLALLRRSPRMTSPVRLVQESGDQAGFVVYVPIFSTEPAFEGGPTGHVGFASIVFRGEDLLSRTFAGQRELAVAIADATGQGPDGTGDLGAWVPPGAEVREDARAVRVHRTPFGRPWHITITAVEGYGVPAAAPLTALIGGLLLTSVLVLLVRNVQQREEAAQVLADRATAGLRASEEALAQSNADLQRSNDELSRFAHVASHDLKEPLRMVTGFAGLLRTQLLGRLGEDGLTTGEQAALAHIDKAAGRMQVLITDLLELASTHGGRVLRERVDVAAELEEVRALLDGQVRESGAELRVGRTDPVVMDPRQVRGLLQNLLTNAIKFRREGVPPVVAVDAVAVDGVWQLDVADNGIGIDPANRAEVLEAFRRMHSRDRYEGTGIGLAICAAVAQSHGGTIEIGDGIDGGTRVTVVIPQDHTRPGARTGATARRGRRRRSTDGAAADYPASDG